MEDSLGISVNFFHLDCLASEVRINVDVDVAMTVVANGCYRWLASRDFGVSKRPSPKTSTASLWKPADVSKLERRPSKFTSIGVRTIRSCVKLRWINPASRSLGWEGGE